MDRPYLIRRSGQRGRRAAPSKHRDQDDFVFRGLSAAETALAILGYASLKVVSMMNAIANPTISA